MRTPKMPLFAVLFALFTTSGCNQAALFSGAPGDYEGTAFSRARGQATESLVSATIAAPAPSELEVREKGSDTHLFKLKLLKNAALSIEVADWAGAQATLTADGKQCFSGQATAAAFTATVCYNGTDLTIDLGWNDGAQSYTLAVSRAVKAEVRAPEAPRSYSVDELFVHATRSNFDSPIQFDRVTESKLEMETAYLNLLPHISVNDVLNLASMNLLGYLKCVGDLAPFLFPTRWLEAGAEKYKTESEFDAWILSRADAASVVQGLAYGVLRDSLAIGTIDSHRKDIEGVRDLVKVRERAGLMQAGSSDDIEAILRSIDIGVSELRGSLAREKIALAHAAGFYNPLAIAAITAGEDSGAETAQAIDDASLATLSAVSLDRSYERRQLADLIKASKLSGLGRYFQWLDPSGDREGTVGFNLVTYVRIGAAQTQELIDKRTKIETAITASVARTASLVNSALEAYALARGSLEVQRRRVDRHYGNLQSGINFSMSDLTSSLRERLKAQLEVVSAQYGYLIARSNLDRLLLAGPYAHIPTDRGEPGWVITGQP